MSVLKNISAHEKEEIMSCQGCGNCHCPHKSSLEDAIVSAKGALMIFGYVDGYYSAAQLVGVEEADKLVISLLEEELQIFLKREPTPQEVNDILSRAHATLPKAQ